MVTCVSNTAEVTVPNWVKDLKSFRRWLDDPDFPEMLPVWWLQGKVWLDMSKEQGFTHNGVRMAIAAVLWQLVNDANSGIFWGEGMFLANFKAGLGGNTDAFYTSNRSIDSNRVALVEGSEGVVVEVHGSPDMVLEVVSKNSITKDNETLFAAYWDAGISEYWLVDARHPPLKFEIWKHTPDGYVAVRKRDGRLKSTIYDKSFQLIESSDLNGLPRYRLEQR